jgi:hypothetical protein
MPLRNLIKRSPLSAATWLRKVLNVQKGGASISSLTNARKLTPIDHVLARVGREPYAAD